MIKNKSGGMQLSLNFLVMLIIAIVIFILSIAFLGDFFKQATELRTSLDEHSRAQIETLLAGNARVAIPIESRTTKPGDPVSYGIGIKNTLPQENFLVKIHSQGTFIPANEPTQSYMLICGDINYRGCSIDGFSLRNYNSGDIAVEYLIGRQGKTQIKINNDDTMVIALNPISKAPRGHYIFNILICSSYSEIDDCPPSVSELYDGSIHKIHMIVN
jgi:hypothetical protein